MRGPAVHWMRADAAYGDRLHWVESAHCRYALCGAALRPAAYRYPLTGISGAERAKLRCPACRRVLEIMRKI